MRKYKSAVYKHIHEEMKYFHAVDDISTEKLAEFESHCFRAASPLFPPWPQAPDMATARIETDLTAEERAIIAAGEKEYREHPETFTPLSALLQEGPPPETPIDTKNAIN
ncbi:hypothetical protein FACS189485_20300 [Spirochaetia bacterium]|nr:hypothetical protein FACS189485_20300 [Spirochaetia bacterium]